MSKQFSIGLSTRGKKTRAGSFQRQNIRGAPEKEGRGKNEYLCERPSSCVNPGWCAPGEDARPRQNGDNTHMYTYTHTHTKIRAKAAKVPKNLSSWRWQVHEEFLVHAYKHDPGYETLLKYCNRSAGNKAISATRTHTHEPCLMGGTSFSTHT